MGASEGEEAVGTSVHDVRERGFEESPGVGHAVSSSESLHAFHLELHTDRSFGCLLFLTRRRILAEGAAQRLLEERKVPDDFEVDSVQFFLVDVRVVCRSVDCDG